MLIQLENPETSTMEAERGVISIMVAIVTLVVVMGIDSAVIRMEARERTAKRVVVITGTIGVL